MFFFKYKFIIVKKETLLVLWLMDKRIENKMKIFLKPITFFFSSPDPKGSCEVLPSLGVRRPSVVHFFVIEVLVPSQESEMSCICLLGVSVSLIFRLDFATDGVVFFVVHFMMTMH